MPISMVTRSKAWECGSWNAEIMGSNLAGAWMSVSCEYCLLKGRDPFNGLMPCPEESYQVWCVWVWFRNLQQWGHPDSLGCRVTKSIIKINNYVIGSLIIFPLNIQSHLGVPNGRKDMNGEIEKCTVNSCYCRCKASIMYHRTEGKNHSLREIGWLHDGDGKNSNLPG